jgi:hypothetical protein
VIPRAWCWITLPLLLLAGEKSPTAPTDRLADVDVRGGSLAECLPQVGARYGLTLAPGSTLREQRVTLVGRAVPLDVWARGLPQLLSPTREAGVFWTRAGDGWRLEESRNRRLLAASLLDADQPQVRALLHQRAEWARTEGAAALHREQGLRQRIARRELLVAAVLDLLGADGRSAVAAGEPRAVTFAMIRRSPYAGILDEWLTQSKPTYAAVPRPAQDGCFLSLFYERRSPGRAEGMLVLVQTRETGFTTTISHESRYRLLPAGSPPSGLRALQQLNEPVPGEGKSGRRVTLVLNDGRSPRLVSFDDALHLLSTRLGLTIVADGYLRGPLEIPPLLTARDCPLERVLTRVAQAWNCDHALLSGSRQVVLFRAREWFAEDEANVPQSVVEDLLPRFAGDRLPSLDDLTRLARLREPQVRKLVEEARMLPAARGMVEPWHADLGVRACLNFYGRLPEALQAHARSPRGLALGKLSAEALEPIRRTLATVVGAVTPELRERLWFSIVAPTAWERLDTPPGWHVWIRCDERPGTNWRGKINAPISTAPRSLRPPADGPAEAGRG